MLNNYLAILFLLQIDHCASQAEISGMFEDAVLLYDLAGKTDSALSVLNHLIAKVWLLFGHFLPIACHLKS